MLGRDKERKAILDLKQTLCQQLQRYDLSCSVAFTCVYKEVFVVEEAKRFEQKVEF